MMIAAQAESLLPKLLQQGLARYVGPQCSRALAIAATAHADTDSAALGKAHVPYGDQGTGVYSLATQGCFDVINKSRDIVIPSFTAALNDASQEGPVTICDFGCADGGTSLPLWTDVVRMCRRVYPVRQIDIKYEDQPNADFESLFAYTQGRLRVPGRTGLSYLEEQPAESVFVSTIGTGFHQQCLPDNTLHFAFSATAMHWLSGMPGPLPAEAIHHTQLAPGSPEAAIWAAHAAKDWDTILAARAKELKPGGQMCIVNFCIDEAGQLLGSTDAVKRKMYDEMLRHWTQMRDDGLITTKELQATSLIMYYRTKEEVLLAASIYSFSFMASSMCNFFDSVPPLILPACCMSHR